MVISIALPSTASWKSRAHSYYPVPDEEVSLASPESKEPHTPTSSGTLFLRPSFWLTALAILSIAFTVRNLLVIQLHSQDTRVTYVEASVARPYMGLEKLARNASSPSWPLSSTLYPDFIGATEDASIQRTLGNGSVVRLDAERTVVLQHRVRDYGLEHCGVKLVFSRIGGRYGHGHGQGEGHATRAYGYIGDEPYLTLWRLHWPSESRAVLASSALPTPLPAQREFLGNIALALLDDDDDGNDESEGRMAKTHRAVQSTFFACDAGSVQTLEIALACTSPASSSSTAPSSIPSTDSCAMEFRLMRALHVRQGLWVVQSEEGDSTGV